MVFICIYLFIIIVIIIIIIIFLWGGKCAVMCQREREREFLQIKHYFTTRALIV